MPIAGPESKGLPRPLGLKVGYIGPQRKILVVPFEDGYCEAKRNVHSIFFPKIILYKKEIGKLSNSISKFI